MNLKRLALIFVLGLVSAVILPAAAEKETQTPAQSQIERAVVSYAANGTRDDEALSALALLDPLLGEKWTYIMNLWEAPITVNNELPDGLPEDDSLCLVGLGFQLNPDGTMRDELVERLKVMLSASEKYPNAVIVCTGGGTAADDPTATEAGRMAEWLEAHGVNPSRLIVEDHSLTTAQNAIYTLDILSENNMTFMWVAPVSENILERYGAVIIKCTDNDRSFRDVLIYRSDYCLGVYDKMFIDTVKSVLRSCPA